MIIMILEFCHEMIRHKETLPTILFGYTVSNCGICDKLCRSHAQTEMKKISICSYLCASMARRCGKYVKEGYKRSGATSSLVH